VTYVSPLTEFGMSQAGSLAATRSPRYSPKSTTRTCCGFRWPNRSAGSARPCWPEAACSPWRQTIRWPSAAHRVAGRPRRQPCRRLRPRSRRILGHGDGRHAYAARPPNPAQSRSVPLSPAAQTFHGIHSLVASGQCVHPLQPSPRRSGGAHRRQTRRTGGLVWVAQS